jgi:hypothetical protein
MTFHLLGASKPQTQAKMDRSAGEAASRTSRNVGIVRKNALISTLSGQN